MKGLFLLALVASLGACASIPELDATLPPGMERADYPKLVPVEPLLAGAEDVQITEETEPGIMARVARLRARAARLRGAIVDSGTRERMRAGVGGRIEQ